jgi:hypothetical protein
MKKYFLLLVVLFAFSGCEKDDICAEDTPATPQLVIDFFDAVTGAKKNVTSLKLKEPNQVKDLVTYDAVSSIKIPLKTYEDFTNMELILNSATPATANSDNVVFNYSRTVEYISKACGYKTLFSLNFTNGAQRIVDSNNWIQSTFVNQINILNENETHVKIYF